MPGEVDGRRSAVLLTSIACEISGPADAAREDAARAQLTVEDVRALARETAAPFAKEQPGHDLLDLAITHTVPLALAARTVAALAIAAELAASASTPDRRAALDAVREPQALIVAWALLIERTATTDAEPFDSAIAVPEAALHRALRELDRARTRLAHGITPLDGGNPDHLSHALATDITALHAEL